MKAYLLKESLDRLWNYTYEGAMLRYLNSWIDQLRWQAKADGEAGRNVARSPGGDLELLPNQGAARRGGGVNGNIKALLRRERGYRDLNYLLLKAQRLAATKTQFIVLQKVA
jgi:hypothetical protein